MDDAQPGATVALKDQLQPFQSAQGRQLTAVLGKDSGEGEEIVLALGSMALVFRCHEDSDTIAISFRACDEVSDFDDLTADPAWSVSLEKSSSGGGSPSISRDVATVCFSALMESFLKWA